MSLSTHLENSKQNSSVNYTIICKEVSIVHTIFKTKLSNRNLTHKLRIALQTVECEAVSWLWHCPVVGRDRKGVIMSVWNVFYVLALTHLLGAFTNKEHPTFLDRATVY